MRSQIALYIARFMSDITDIGEAIRPAASGETQMTKPMFTEFFRAVWMEAQFQRTQRHADDVNRATFAHNMAWVGRVQF